VAGESALAYGASAFKTLVIQLLHKEKEWMENSGRSRDEFEESAQWCVLPGGSWTTCPERCSFGASLQEVQPRSPCGSRADSACLV